MEVQGAELEEVAGVSPAIRDGAGEPGKSVVRGWVSLAARRKGASWL